MLVSCNPIQKSLPEPPPFAGIRNVGAGLCGRLIKPINGSVKSGSS